MVLDWCYCIIVDFIVVVGMVFMLDSQFIVIVIMIGGGWVWSVDICLVQEIECSVFGGGVVFEGNCVFVILGYGEVVVLDVCIGGVVWCQCVDVLIFGVLMVVNGVVYVMGCNLIGWVICVNDGKVLWCNFGSEGMVGVMGVLSFVVFGVIVIFFYVMGELIVVDIVNGNLCWVGNVGGLCIGWVIMLFCDMIGDLVIVGNMVYVGIILGWIVVFDMDMGMMKWDVVDGVFSLVVVVGNLVFLVNDQVQFVWLDVSNGVWVWV